MTKCNRYGKDNPAEVHTCTPLITKYGIKGKQYSEDEIKESEDKVNKAKQEFEDLINN